MKKLIPADTVDSAGNVLETTGENMKELIPADTVDSAGNVWPTTGENIRKGAKEFYENEVRSIADILFPVGSIYCGENALITSIGSWEIIAFDDWYLIFLGKGSKTGTLFEKTPEFSKTGNTVHGVALRMWRRVA